MFTHVPYILTLVLHCNFIRNVLFWCQWNIWWQIHIWTCTIWYDFLLLLMIVTSPGFLGMVTSWSHNLCYVVGGVVWFAVFHFSPIQQFYVFVWLVTAYHAEMANFPGTIWIQINFHALCCFQCFKKLIW